MGTKEPYTIGQLCDSDRMSCEKTYFKDYLDKISTLSNEPRTFFSDIFIQEDQAGYSGNCPCPNNSDRAGNSCGGRSSYSKHGQISYCYDRDVSDSQIAYKKTSMIADAQKSLDDAVQQDLNIYHEMYTFFIVVILYGALWFYFRKKDPIS